MVTMWCFSPEDGNGPSYGKKKSKNIPVSLDDTERTNRSTSKRTPIGMAYQSAGRYWNLIFVVCQ